MIATLLGLTGSLVLLFSAVLGEFLPALLGLGLCVGCALWRGYVERDN
jgi:hypothetical protein